MDKKLYPLLFFMFAVSGLLAAGAAKAIVKLSPTNYVVYKSKLPDRFELTQILMSARLVPFIDKKSGVMKGFLFQMIEPASGFGELGLKQGDVLLSVNKILLDDLGKGLEAAMKLKGATAITLGIQRENKPLTLNYQIK